MSASMDHTGPGVFTDSVLAYLKARYRVEWHELRGLARPLRIGEIVILPSIGQCGSEAEAVIVISY